MLYYVYVIVNNVNEKLYVGKTGNPDDRLRTHICAAKRGESGSILYNAMRKYGFDAFEMFLLETNESETTIFERERYWISTLDTKRNGYNMTDGGEGASGAVVSAETRKKKSLATKGLPGHPCSDETKRKISEANKGKNRDDGQRKRLSIALKGKKRSEEARARMSEAAKIRHKEKPHSQETREQIAETLRGRKSSEEAKTKIGNANRGKIVSSETRAKMAEAGFARTPPSAETRAKMSASAKERCARQKKEREEHDDN